jgi:uncharacterized Zn finger protein
MLKSPASNNLWFNPNTLGEFASTATMLRGRDLYVGQRVLGLVISAEESCWRLEGEVQGSLRRPYEVSIELTLTPQGEIDTWDSDCSCPVGYNCKHGVALTMKAAYQGLRILGANMAYRIACRPKPSCCNGFLT